MATHKLIIAGFGGQGVLLTGQIIAYAGMMEGKEVTWMPSYGPEMRGGTANCTVIVSDKKISSPVINEATTVVAMNLPSLVKFESMVEPGGKIFINSSLIGEKPKRDDVEVYSIKANEIAADLNNAKVANMVMLGAVVDKTGIVKRESVERVLEKLFTGNKADLIALNKQALRAWNK
ncbi:MAG: 2-oxoacid:ferredoxin oxidoreductase subunit gamma [Clostridiales bacterium]|jgi:2-oxoglutarate ferredoxin oxidoreductase subunit gamma|nr:2-oxoacid:ferredoxin oxidoreductase subunit gamma [Clostridiales bacterium]